MQINVSSEIRRVLDIAVGLCTQHGRFYVGTPDVFESLVIDPAFLPKQLAERWLSTFQIAAQELRGNQWKGVAPVATGEMLYTPRCIAHINEAGRLSARMGGGPARPAHLLLAILADAHSAPSRALDRRGANRGECLRLLRSALLAQGATAGVTGARVEQREAPAGHAARGPGHAVEGFEKAPFALEALTRDLTRLAREGKVEPAIGRKREIVEILQILMRKTKNNAMLVGEAGVGKTKVVEGLALIAARGGADNVLANCRILELSVGAVMSGTQYRGAFEEKMLALLETLKQSPHIVLFIDEAHVIMGAGSTNGDSVDMANLLKPALARGEFRCIGSTTLQEYRKFIERDPAMDRRFQMVRIDELSETATYRVLRALQPSLESHHGVVISEKAIHAAITLPQRYMTNRRLPDKSIDVLDQACARVRLKIITAKADPARYGAQTVAREVPNAVLPHDVRKVVSHATAIPIEDITAEERLHLGSLERRLGARIIGQDEAVSKVAALVRKSRAGLGDPNRPDAVMLFLGPSGVGKTQLAKELADSVFGSRDHLVTFDMSEYIEEHSVSRLLGAPPGYQGSDQEGRLTGAVRNTPFCILLFDEIEKAHPRVFDMLLPILDEGRLKDSMGRDVSFRSTIIIMTSNIGAEFLCRAETGQDRVALMAELRRRFRPEFINRIDEIVPFYPLLFEDIRSILHLAIQDLARRLQGKNMRVRVYQWAYELLAEQGYSAEYGARELRRVVEREVVNPISERIVAGKFKSGDTIEVLMEEGRLSFRRGVAEGTAGDAR